MQKYERGDTMKIRAVFTDSDSGSLVDPTTPMCCIKKPDGTGVHDAAMSQVGTGTYTAEYTLSTNADLGYWYVRCYGTYDSKVCGNAEHVKVVEVI